MINLFPFLCEVSFVNNVDGLFLLQYIIYNIESKSMKIKGIQMGILFKMLSIKIENLGCCICTNIFFNVKASQKHNKAIQGRFPLIKRFPKPATRFVSSFTALKGTYELSQ